jgi:dTDP-glucose 4,6-dehydratase
MRAVENVVTRMMANPLAGDLDHVLAHTPSLWDELRGARLFVTGGTGFFGCWLLETLLWANDRLALNASVVVLTRNPGAFKSKAPHLARHQIVTLHEGDVRTFAFPDGAFTHVIHGATDSSALLGALDDRVLFDTIVEGTRHIVEFAKQTGVGKMLLVSSGAVYGRQPEGLDRIGEDYGGGPNPTDSQAAYAEGKRAAEMLCALHADGFLSPTIARCFAFVGPYLPLNMHFAIGNFIRDGLERQPIRISGNGKPQRSYLYAADLAIWLWTILLRGRVLRPYNVGSGQIVTIREIAEVVARVFGPGVEIQVGNTSIAGSAARYVPDVTRTESELGLRQTVSLEDAVRRTAQWNMWIRGRSAA